MRYYIEHLPMTIPMGVQSENNAEAVEFDVSDWLARDGSLSFSVWVTRPGETEAYQAANATLKDGVLYWWPTGADTAIAGEGRVEILAVSANRRMLSGWTATSIRETTTETTTDAPVDQRPWLDQALLASEEAKAAAASAAASADQAEGVVKKEIATLTEELDTLNKGGLVLKEDFIGQQVNDWLDEHPEATTTVQDSSLGVEKFTEDAKKQTVKDYVTPQMFGAVGDGVHDDSHAIQTAIDQTEKGNVLLPAGTYKTTFPIICKPGVSIIGCGASESIVEAYNCDCFVVNPEWGTAITGLTMYSRDAEGGYYPKSHIGIKLNGTDVAPGSVNNVVLCDLDIRGFLDGVYLGYTQFCTMTRVKTLECTNGVRMFGLCVNNSMQDCDITAVDNCLKIEHDPAKNTRGEGLIVSNCKLLSAGYGVNSVSFLSLKITNCIIDLIKNQALNLSGVQDCSISDSWIYSENEAVFIPNMSVEEKQHTKIAGNHITSYNNQAIFVGANATNVIISENTIQAKQYCLYLEVGSKKAIVANNCFTTSSPVSIFVGGINNTIVNNTGDGYIQNYASSQPNIVMNNSGNPRIIPCIYDAPPTEGTFQDGDIVFYKSPKAGQKIGCVYVAGAWKEFGSIDA